MWDADADHRNQEDVAFTTVKSQYYLQVDIRKLNHLLLTLERWKATQSRVNSKRFTPLRVGVQIHPGSVWNRKWLGPDSKGRRQEPQWCWRETLGDTQEMTAWGSVSNWSEEERYSPPNREKHNQSEFMFTKNQVTEIWFLLCCCHLLGWDLEGFHFSPPRVRTHWLEICDKNLVKAFPSCSSLCQGKNTYSFLCKIFDIHVFVLT